MRVIDVITLTSQGRTSRVELCQGDLTALAEGENVDLLVVSAIPNDYTPTASSLIGALQRRGISVAELARKKEVDLRHAFSCWLSAEIIHKPAGMPYKRILCFEPYVRGRPPEVVGDIFRALAPFLGGPPRVETVAMPLVATGDQDYTIEVMLEPLVEAAVRWMQAGMPLSVLKIAVYKEAATTRARQSFERIKKKLDLGVVETKSHDYHVFISYAHADRRPADLLYNRLSALALSVFMDRQALEEGRAWQRDIFTAIDRCKRLVALYSPAYVGSKVCQEEFNIAWARGRKTERNIIFPLYWKSAELPTYMDMLVYADCREAVEESLPAVCDRLVQLSAG
jgi:hypothetical protein